jgi:hypothetical protein
MFKRCINLPVTTKLSAEHSLSRHGGKTLYIANVLLCASVKDNDPTESNGQANRKSKPFLQMAKDT